MRYLFTAVFLIVSAFISAQGVYPLHPSVGDTIDLNEKLDYSLFPKVDNNNFIYAVIGFNNDNFELYTLLEEIVDEETGLVLSYRDSLIVKQEQIIEEQQKIQKINEYFHYLAEEAKKPKQKESFPVLERKIPVRFEGPIAEIMKKEARMKTRLAEDERMMNDFKMGMRPREMRLDFRR
jgi:hypothetical protein